MDLETRIVKRFKTHIPVWALSYIHDLGYFTVEAEKLRMIEIWVEEQKDNVCDSVDIDLISFTGEVDSSPAFGEEPVVCGECIVTIRRSEEMDVH